MQIRFSQLMIPYSLPPRSGIASFTLEVSNLPTACQNLLASKPLETGAKMANILTTPSRLLTPHHQSNA